MHITWRAFQDSGPILGPSCIPYPYSGGGCRHITNLLLRHDDFLVHLDAHSDLVSDDLLCSPDAKLFLLLTVAALIHVSGRRLPIILALAAAAVAACGALCAFTSPQRTEVLAAVRKRCSPPNHLMPSALSEAVMQQAERQLPGAQAALLLTMVEAHLEESGSAPGRPMLGRPMLPFSRVILGIHGPQLGEADLPVRAAVLRLMPAAAAYTVGLADNRPHAVTKKCLLAALLKAVASSLPLLGTTIKEDTIEQAWEAIQMPALQLVLHFEQLFLQQQQELPHQHQHYDSATAMPSPHFCSYFCQSLTGSKNRAERRAG